MKFKKLSIAAISLISLAVSNITFASNDSNEANEFFKSFNNEERKNITDPMDSLDKDLANLENSITAEDDPDVLINAVKDNGKITSDENKVSAELEDQASQDVVFLRNIPEGTRITMNKEFILLPQNKFIIFHDGKRVIENPLVKDPVNSFCYIELKPSGKARVLKEAKQFTVTKNVSQLSTLVNKDDPEEKLKIYETKLSVDNESVKWITCYSASKLENSDNLKPLTVKDLRIQSNSAFKLEFPAYEEI
jgi:hypothetical protein